MNNKINNNNKATKCSVIIACALLAVATMPTVSFAKKAKTSDDILGTYKIISTKYGIDRAITKCYKDKKGGYYFKITKVLKKDGIENITTCQNCPGKFKNKPVQGMIVAWGFKPTSKSNPYEYGGGYGIDPWSGRMFQGSVKMNNSKRIVRIKASPLGTKMVSRKFNFIRMSDKR